MAEEHDSHTYAWQKVPAKVASFHWEDRNALGHACWFCGTKSNNPKAKLTCFGKHLEPCVRYHQGMHAIGKSHECWGCIDADELHYKRHKEIAEIIMRIQKIDQYGTADGNEEKIQLKLLNTESLDVNNERGQEAIMKDGQVVQERHIPTKTTRKTAAQKRCDKKAVKDAKSQAKALRNQKRFDSGITSQDVEVVAKAIHGETANMRLAIHSPAEDDQSIVQHNLKYVAAVHSKKKVYAWGVVDSNRYVKKRLDQAAINRTHDILHQLDIAGFERDHTGKATRSSTSDHAVQKKGAQDGKARKERRVLLEKVEKLIQEDLVKSDDEEAQTLIRMAGYYRYTNKNIFYKLMEFHEEWAWATGESLGNTEEYEPEAENGAHHDMGDDNIDWDAVEQEALAAAAAAQVQDDDADAELNATFMGDQGGLVQLAYCRFILMPENATAYDRIMAAVLEALVLVHQDEDVAARTPSDFTDADGVEDLVDSEGSRYDISEDDEDDGVYVNTRFLEILRDWEAGVGSLLFDGQNSI